MEKHMKLPMKARLLAVVSVLVLFQAGGAEAGGFDEFRVKRENAFEFAAKPAVTRDGDRLTITFETKGRCDATVAIEDVDGRIVRHLASGVLGPNAPKPFSKSSRRQELSWDGKDDGGRYIDSKDALIVRVSLGLKPHFERTLFWSPHKRVGRYSPVLCAAPEGVYVAEGQAVDQIRLFDHDGNYVRAVYPSSP
jgi:hypothetical protein